MTPGFFGTYDPLSDRDRRSDRDKFIDDKILLLEMLPKFYFYCHMTKPYPALVEDDIHHTLRAEVDNGFRRLTDATHFVIAGIQEEIEFHKNIKMETWSKQNDDVMQSFVEAIKFWEHQDQQGEIAPRLNRKQIPEPFYLYRKHLWSWRLWRYRALMQFHESGIAFANAWGSIMSCAHLYNAVNGGKTQDTMWKDLDIVIGLQQPETLFVGKAPTAPDECSKRFALAMGTSAADQAKSTRTKRGLIRSRKGPKRLEELGATMQTFRSRICNSTGPKNIRAEDVQKVLKNSGSYYELDDDDNAQRVYKNINEASRKASANRLSVSKCVGLVRELVHAEVVEIAFDYVRLHRQCWQLLRDVKDYVCDDLIRIFGSDYMQKESELPFIVGYVLTTASGS